MTERRAATRHRSFLQGRILFNNRRSTLDCLVRDFSERGAKLKFSEAVAIPEFVELQIPSKNETYRGRVRWRVGEEAGVEFETDETKVAASGSPSTPQAGAATPADLVARVSRLETELAALQRKVSELMSERRRRQGDE